MNQADNDLERPAVDSGLQCLMMMAKLHGIAADPLQLQHRFGRQRFDVQDVLLAARWLGMSAKCIRQQRTRLDRIPLPAIGIDRSGDFFVLAKIDQGTGEALSAARILIQRPGQSPQVLSHHEFEALWSAQVILMTSKASFAGEASRFDFSWFIPAVVKYRKVLGEVLLISLVLQLIGLVTPLFFQVVMDKVLVNHAMMTLNVVAVGLLAATVFEALLTGIRTASRANHAATAQDGCSTCGHDHQAGQYECSDRHYPCQPQQQACCPASSTGYPTSAQGRCGTGGHDHQAGQADQACYGRCRQAGQHQYSIRQYPRTPHQYACCDHTGQ